jgi:hypothetical protein
MKEWPDIFRPDGRKGNTMKNKLLLPVFLFIVIMALAGCATTFQPTGSCVDGNSIILKITDGNPTGLDKALLTANFVLLDTKKVTPEQVNEFLDEVETKVKSGITYIDLADWLDIKIQQINKYVGVSMILIGDNVAAIGISGGNSLVSQCDSELLLAHINHQRLMTALY